LTLTIPIIYLKEKQAFRKEGQILRYIGSPIELARKFKKDGYKLIHIVDLDAIAGLATNTDMYDSLTYIINIQVECAPLDGLVKKLLLLKCRVVLPPSELDLSALRERKLLVAKVANEKADVGQFHDVVLEDADEDKVKAFKDLGKRIIIYEEDRKKVKQEVWGIITGSF
jgi:uncharacterized protein related to proFAR isomerase